MSTDQPNTIDPTSQLQFDRYKAATLAHQVCATDRMALGRGQDPTIEHLAAIDQADAALSIAVRELDAARFDYLRDPGGLWLRP